MQRNIATNNIFKVHPNPSSSIVYVDLRNSDLEPVKNAKISAELFDMFGQSKGKIRIHQNKAFVNVEELTKGIYVLKIRINDKTEIHQIAVR